MCVGVMFSVAQPVVAEANTDDTGGAGVGGGKGPLSTEVLYEPQLQRCPITWNATVCNGSGGAGEREGRAVRHSSVRAVRDRVRQAARKRI